MKFLRSNLAPVLWLALFAAILSLWAGSYWRYAGGTFLRNRVPPGSGYDGYGVASEVNRLLFFMHGTDSGSIDRQVYFSTRVPDPPGFRDLAWAQADRAVHLGAIRWYRLTSAPQTVWIVDIHYAFLAVIAGFFTWRSWSKRRRRHARGFEVAASETSPPAGG